MLKGPPWQQSDMIVAVYDVTREETFEKVAKVAEGNSNENFKEGKFGRDFV